MKKSRKINIMIDPSIKIGDRVYLQDGSALSCVKYNEKDFYIVCAYPEITKSPLKLMRIEATVVEININDIVITNGDNEWGYLQDIIVDVNGVKFRTASKFVGFQPRMQIIK